MPTPICDLPIASADEPWPIPDLLPEGLCLLSSKSPADARMLALQLALSITSNTPALDNFAPTSGQALYFSFHEHERSFMARVRSLLGDHPLPSELAFTTGGTSWLEHGITTLTTCLSNFPQTRLIVIDSLSSLFPPERFWNARRKQALLDQLNRLAHEHHLCILLLHTQARHSRNDPFDAIVCPSLLLEAIETLFVLEHDRTQARAILHIQAPLLRTRLKLHLPTNENRWHLSDRETLTAPSSPHAENRRDGINPSAIHGPASPTTDLSQTISPSGSGDEEAPNEERRSQSVSDEEEAPNGQTGNGW